MHTYEIAVKTRLVRKIGWTAILFAVFCIQTGLDKFPTFARRVQISIPTFRLAKPRSSGSSAMHPSAQPRHHVLLTKEPLQPSVAKGLGGTCSACSHLTSFPTTPQSPPATPRRHRVGLNLLIPLMQPCSQAAGYIWVSQPRSSPVNPVFVLPALCFVHSFQFTWPKECACWNNTACTSCSALLSGSHQWQVSFFEISHVTASIPSGLSSAICQSVIFHLDCNASEHRAFAFTWLMISRCLKMVSLFLF